MPRRLGLPVPVIILLAAFAALRVVPHDLGIVSEGSVVAWLLVFRAAGELAYSRAAAAGSEPFSHSCSRRRRLRCHAGGRPSAAVGGGVGWRPTEPRRQPRGNLEDEFAPGLEAVVFRASALFSSLVNGTVVGAVAGFVARVIEHLRRT